MTLQDDIAAAFVESGMREVVHDLAKEDTVDYRLEAPIGEGWVDVLVETKSHKLLFEIKTNIRMSDHGEIHDPDVGSSLRQLKKYAQSHPEDIVSIIIPLIDAKKWASYYANEGMHTARSDVSAFILASKEISDSNPHSSYNLTYTLHRSLAKTWLESLDLMDATGKFLVDDAHLLVKPDPAALGVLDNDRLLVIAILNRTKIDYDQSQSSLRIILDLTSLPQGLRASEVGVGVYYANCYLIVATNYTRTIQRDIRSAQNSLNSLPANGNLTQTKQLLDEAQTFLLKAEDLLGKANGLIDNGQVVAYAKAAIGNATIAGDLLRSALKDVRKEQQLPPMDEIASIRGHMSNAHYIRLALQMRINSSATQHLSGQMPELPEQTSCGMVVTDPTSLVSLQSHKRCSADEI
jgi:hypothetical protein